jgi:undecaprenyl-diphosphatase
MSTPQIIMDTFQAIILAIVEGLTEFLPVSSTAHMEFVNPLLKVDPTPFRDMFEVVVQLAAIIAVVVIYRKKFFDFSRIKFYLKLLIALIPALIGGILLKKHIDAALGNISFIAWVMLIGGIILLFVDNFFKNPVITSEEKVSNKKALIIGCGQVLSIIYHGISRSAATIITGMSQKLSRSAAAEFSFFVAVPTMFAASVKSFWDACKKNYISVHQLSEEQAKTIKVGFHEILGKENLHTLFTHTNIHALLIGCIVSFIVALIAVQFFIGAIKKYGFRIWGIYRIIIGTVMLLLIWKGIVQ